MKNVFFLLVLAGIMAALPACKTTPKTQLTINGHKIQLLHDAPGEVAKEGDYVYFTYRVRAKDSLIFESSSQTPVIKFRLPKIEKTNQQNSLPITEGFLFMSKGDSATIYHVLDEKMKASLQLPGISELQYDIYLIDIKNEEQYKQDIASEEAARAKAIEASKAELVQIEARVNKTLADYKSKRLGASLITTPSGLKYIVHEAGDGPKTENGKMVTVNYYGCLMDGTRFDDSWSRGTPFRFPLGQKQVIAGWDEGVANLNEGAKATLIIPYNLAYGEAGSPPAIPAKADLLFYIEVQKSN